MYREDWIRFVGDRFIRRDRTKITLIAAVAISVATLICVLSIMNGLQFITINNLIQIDSYHLVIQESLSRQQRTAIRDAVLVDARVDSAVSFAELHTIAHAAASDISGVSIRAVDPAEAATDRRFIEQLNIVDGSFDLSADQILIGTSLARRLGVAVGDRLQIYGHSGQMHHSLVSGLFRSGYPGFDNGLIFMSIAHARDTINRAAPVHIGIKYADLADEALLIERVGAHATVVLGRAATLIDWRQSNTAIFSALKLEKIFIIFTVGMIFVIVAINIRQSLARKVRQYADQLAILKAVGGMPHQVQFIITYMGFYIGMVGAICGVVAGLWLALSVNLLFYTADAVVNGTIRVLNSLILLLDSTVIQPLPYVSAVLFFIDIVEYRLLLGECVAIFLFAVAIATGAAYFASRQTVAVRPIETLQRR